MPKLIDHARRREEVAEAAWRVISRDGVAKLSVRAVAAEAGCSTGALRHIFATQSELIEFALRLVIERATARIGALPQRATAIDAVEDVAAQLLPLDDERRVEMEVYLALFQASNTDAALGRARDTAQRAVRSSCEWMIDQLDNGVDLVPDVDRELEAARLHALIDGIGMHLISLPVGADQQWAYRMLRWHIHSLGTRAQARFRANGE